MRIAWLTDLHLGFAPEKLDRLFSLIKKVDVDALFVTGDTAEGADVSRYLPLLASRAGVPLYFVLGNHDFYGSSIASVREWARSVTNDEKVQIYWMEEKGCAGLTDDTAVVGVDGWGDAWYGNFESKRVHLNDWTYIRELFLCEDRIAKLRELGREAGNRLRAPLLEALRGYKNVYVLTHVPPWDTAAWHMGALSEPDWMPWFTCKAVGDVIEECAALYPDTKVTVLCGHMHSKGYCRRTENVECFTGGAEYGFPQICDVLEI